MASGMLLVLIGDECKRQAEYHGLDKEYEFSVLLGIGSDTQDVLGRLQTSDKQHDLAGAAVLSEGVRLGLAARSAPSESTAAPANDSQTDLSNLTTSLTGTITLPYPHFSSKTVQGKPLHTWTLEGRLHEIEIPTNQSTVYELEHTKTETIDRQTMVEHALAKINTIPPVTDPRKVIGNDFRRTDVRADWERIRTDFSLPDSYTILHFRCIASAGTYMRSLSELIAQKLGTLGLAWHIHRTKIGVYDPDTTTWTTEYSSS